MRIHAQSNLIGFPAHETPLRSSPCRRLKRRRFAEKLHNSDVTCDFTHREKRRQAQENSRRHPRSAANSLVAAPSVQPDASSQNSEIIAPPKSSQNQQTSSSTNTRPNCRILRSCGQISASPKHRSLALLSMSLQIPQQHLT